MSASLSPTTVRLAAESQLFVTIQMSHSIRPLPKQPLAPSITWDPVGQAGFVVKLLVLTASDEEVQSWDYRDKPVGKVWLNPGDSLTARLVS